MKHTLTLSIYIDFQIELPSDEYPDCATIQDVVKVEQASFESDPDALLNLIEVSNPAVLTVKVRE